MQFSIQGEAGQSHHRSVFAALQCTINFCSFTGSGLSDPVTVSNMIWFLRGYFFSRAISLFSFILSFVICSKYTEFQFLSLYKSMSRRLQWLLLPHHESGWSWVTIPSHLSWGQAVTQDFTVMKVCQSLEIPGLLCINPRGFIYNVGHSICILLWCRKGKRG